MKKENPACRWPLEDTLEYLCKVLIRHWTRKRQYQFLDDLIQEGMTKAYEKIHEWKGQSKLETFLVRVGINAGRDWLDNEEKHKRNTQAEKERLYRQLKFYRRGGILCRRNPFP